MNTMQTFEIYARICLNPTVPDEVMAEVTASGWDGQSPCLVIGYPAEDTILTYYGQTELKLKTEHIRRHPRYLNS